MRFQVEELIHKIFNFLFPDTCASCRKTGTPLCSNCLSKIPIVNHPKKDFVCVFSYKDKLVKKTLWDLKFFNKQNLAKIFASILNDKILEEISEKFSFDGSKNIIIIPVPASKKRRREREVNQSELLAKYLSKEMGVNYYKNALLKVRETKRQVETKNREERLVNLVGAFEYNNNLDLNDELVILIDDITTTGATLNECEKVLNEAGIKNVLKTAVAGP